MLDVIIPKKDALQVVDDDIDSPVGCIPDICIVRPARRDYGDFDHRLLEVRQQSLPRSFVYRIVDHGFPVFLNRLRQPLHRMQRLVDGEGDDLSVIMTAAVVRRDP